MWKMKARHHPWTNTNCYYCPANETFEHLCLSLCNPHSTDFHKNLVHSVTMYCTTANIPQAFQGTFLDAIQMWFSSLHEDEWLQWQGPSILLTCQCTIGWKQMFCGFFSKQWHRFLHICIQRNQNVQWYKNNTRTSVAGDPNNLDNCDQEDFIVTFNDTHHQH